MKVSNLTTNNIGTWFSVFTMIPDELKNLK